MDKLSHLAAGGQPFNISGINGIITAFIGPAIVLAGLGILIKVHSQRNFAAAASGVLVLIVGLVIVGLGLTKGYNGVATSLSHAFFG